MKTVVVDLLWRLITVLFCRLEMEEQARQKLQLEKVNAESKIKKLEETLALNEDTSAKVSILCQLSWQSFAVSASMLLVGRWKEHPVRKN